MVTGMCKFKWLFYKQGVKEGYSIRNIYPINLNLRRLSSTCQEEKKKKKKIEVSIACQGIPIENIRNFGIVAHIDHGKSTLCDRILEITGAIKKSSINKQVLDKLPVERERGITVKAQTASMLYTFKGNQYLLNLIDTPGHVDFSYEVSRSLAACQGVVLLVDANQGVQAQTVANYKLSSCHSLTIIPVVNKIDLRNAKPEQVMQQIANVFKFQPSDILKISAKEGTGCKNLLDEIIQRIPAPPGNVSNPFRALIFDSWYDKHRGVVIMISITDGCIKEGDEIYVTTNKSTYHVKETGVMSPDENRTKQLNAGQVGYIVPNMRNSKEAKIGDTIHHTSVSVTHLPTLVPAKPMVFAGFYPSDQSQHSVLRTSIEKLVLNDPSVDIQLDSSPALGQGWRLGFLGFLHLEVFSQRLDQEFNVSVVVTAPSVPYKVKLIKTKKNKLHDDELTISNPLQFPDPTTVEEVLEPMVLATVITPVTYLEKISHMCLHRRGVEKSSQYIDEHTIMLLYKFPLSEIIVDFIGDIKSASSGYASFDYEDIGFESTEVKKVNFVLNGQCVEELSVLVHASRIQEVARRMCLKLSETIPQQQYEVAIQATLGKRVIARETIKAVRKDVLAKCYGGDITRKMKLLNRQAEGKKKMRMIGKIQVPRDVFITVLKK